MSALALAVITPEQTNALAALLALVAGLGAVVIVLRPLVRAWARRLEGSAGDHALRQELEDLRDRVAELEARDMRLGELEERLDFTERMLASGRPPTAAADTPPEPAGSPR